MTDDHHEFWPGTFRGQKQPPTLFLKRLDILSPIFDRVIISVFSFWPLVKIETPAVVSTIDP